MIIEIVLFLVIFLNLLLGIFVLSQNYKSLNNRLYALVSVIAAVWTFTNYMTGVSPAIEWLKSTYAFGSLVMSTGLVWILLLTDGKLSKRKVYIISLLSIFFFIGSYKTGFIITEYNQVYLGARFTGDPGWGLTLYTIFYIFVSLMILWKLYDAQKATDNPDKKYQLKYVFAGSLITLLISGLSSFILPHFSIFLFGGIDSLGFLIFLIAVAYSITRHHLFDIKLVAIELGIFLLWTIILIRLSLAQNNREVLIEITLFFITLVLGIILIRTSLREATQRDQLEDLNLHLAQKVDEQTKEVKKAYELEKKAKRELEKLNETKDQFIMITQHNLRTPVTALKWQIDSLLTGHAGKIDPEARKTLEDSETSIDTLTRTVNDFLNITALKAGSQILDVKNGNLKPLLESVIQELKIDIESMNISINYSQDSQQWPDLKIDINKMREVLLIIIENAVRYNFENGHITIKNKMADNYFKMIIENTGVGITKEDRQNIFEKLFYRSKRALTTHPTGMGVGLSVSRAIIRAHHGDIEIFSEGENKGARVEITIPMDFIKEVRSI